MLRSKYISIKPFSSNGSIQNCSLWVTEEIQCYVFVTAQNGENEAVVFFITAQIVPSC